MYRSAHEFRPAMVFACGTLLLAVASPASAQVLAAPSVEQEVIIKGKRLKPVGSVTDAYSEDDIATFSAVSVGEVIDRLEQRNNGNRYTVIVNGKRISDLASLRDLPPEALQRLEVLDHLPATFYGGKANEKVLNLVLKERFSSKNTNAEVRLPTEGGTSTVSDAMRYSHIAGDTRINMAISLSRSSILLANSRNDLLTAKARDSLFAYRSLLPASAVATATAGAAFPVGPNSASLSLVLSEVGTQQRTRFLLPSVNVEDGRSGSDNTVQIESLVDRSRSKSLQISGSASGSVKGFNWVGEVTQSISSNISAGHPSGKLIYVPSQVAISSNFDNFILLRNRSRLSQLQAQITISGTVLQTPVFDVSANARAGYSRLSSISANETATSRREVGVSDKVFHFDVYVPLKRASRGLLDALGGLAINSNVDLTSRGRSKFYASAAVGANWQLTDNISINIAKGKMLSLPNFQYAAAPEIIAENSLVYDGFAQQYVSVRTLSGGVDGLKNTEQSDYRFGIDFAKRFSNRNVSGSISYLKSILKHPVFSANLPSAALQNVFPDLFVRDVAGHLEIFDIRPFNAASETKGLVQGNIHFLTQINSENGVFRNGVAATIDLNVNAEWNLEDTVYSASNRKADLLHSPIFSGQSASPYLVGAEITYSTGLINLQAGARWRSASLQTKDRSLDLQSLRYSPFFSTHAQASITLRRAKSNSHDSTPYRITVSVDNLLNRRPLIRDAAGHVSESYQPALVDPLGRIIALRLDSPL